MNSPRLYIQGAGGSIGTDLRKALPGSTIEQVPTPNDADFIALCVPSNVAGEMLDQNRFSDKVIIDFSGAAKRKRLGQYGLMLDHQTPWQNAFNKDTHVYGNPGCIASAAILGMYHAGLTNQQPSEVAIASVGGTSHAHTVDDNEIKLSKRLRTHPHVAEIQTALGGITKVTSFMPLISGGIDKGLLVSVSGKTLQSTGYNLGTTEISTSSVVGTDAVQHRLELNTYGSGYAPDGFEFSLAVAIDNLRLVTKNAIKLIEYITE